MKSETAQPKVVMVYESGTSDPYTALYIDSKLVVTSVRLEVSCVLKALKIKPTERFVRHGFDGHFPDNLNKLKTFPKPVERRRR